jgi:hypothetical protein
MVRQRNWGKSNAFSEGHRTCLPGNFCLWDIDGFLLDENRDPCAIYEGKYKMLSKDRGDFIDSFYNPRNLQASFLIKLSHILPVWICEESSNLWWKVNNGKLEKTNNPNLDIINTENRVYVEDILNRTIGENSFTGVFVRTEGEKVCELDPFGAYLSFRLKVHKILVNDIFEDNTVYFKNNDVVVKSSLDESQSGNWYQDWIDLGIL